MNAPDFLRLPDVQASADERALAIQRVGIRGLRYPLTLRGADGAVAHTVATVESTVALPAAVKGAHMSRFVAVLEESRATVFDSAAFAALHAHMLARLESERGRIQFRFPYFLQKRAPVSGIASLLDIDATVEVDGALGEPPRQTLSLVVPVTSLCPCSKEISAYGAHNQRSHITLTVAPRAPLRLEELARVAEEEASSELYGLLKRADEKWVTERAYENPKFVEDLVRDIALRLHADSRLSAWRVESENFESIHNHSAYALIESGGI